MSHDLPGSELHRELRKLCDEAYARAVAIFHADGHLLDASGEIHNIDITNLSVLAAGALSAGSALIGMIDGGPCSGFFIEGASHQVFLSRLSNDKLLAVVFNQSSNQGIVRIRVNQHRRELERVLSRQPMSSMNISLRQEYTHYKEPEFEDYMGADKVNSSTDVSGFFDQLSEQEVDRALGLD